ncbi:TM2 domain-containing protein [Sulfitobacter aestuarii]|uniref:TM2 domain-containing protein n=1 Tax=Sulfitobacter aestuarii TaxID=2161676 RepID=A0ABW5TYZ6_9RHOB
MALTTEQQMLVEQRLSNEKKSVGVAYLLWFFTGWIGGHRFYLGKIGSGVAMLILTILGWLTFTILIGFVFFAVVAIWALIDLFLIPGMIDNDQRAKRLRISNDMMSASGLPADPAT